MSCPRQVIRSSFFAGKDYTSLSCRYNFADGSLSNFRTPFHHTIPEAQCASHFRSMKELRYGTGGSAVDQYFNHMLMFHPTDLMFQLSNTTGRKNFILQCKKMPIIDYLMRLLFRIVEFGEYHAFTLDGTLSASFQLFSLFSALVGIAPPKKETLFDCMKFYMMKKRFDYKSHRNYVDQEGQSI
jgi:hypothetical protein